MAVSRSVWCVLGCCVVGGGYDQQQQQQVVLYVEVPSAGMFFRALVRLD